MLERKGDGRTRANAIVVGQPMGYQQHQAPTVGQTQMQSHEDQVLDVHQGSVRGGIP